MFSIDRKIRGRDHGDSFACRMKDVLDHMAGCRFAVCSGDAYHDHLTAGKAVSNGCGHAFKPMPNKAKRIVVANFLSQEAKQMKSGE